MYVRDFCQPPCDCFDVGAGVGYHSLLLATAGRGRIAAFECDDESRRQLRSNVELNEQLRGRISLVGLRVAAASDAAAGTISVDDAAYRDDLFVPDFVKVDTDGAEQEVLEGATELLSRRRPHIIVETHSRELEASCGQLLRASGYAPIVVDQRRVSPDFRPVDHNRWLVAGGRR
jgi:hypothetical protein